MSKPITQIKTIRIRQDVFNNLPESAKENFNAFVLDCIDKNINNSFSDLLKKLDEIHENIMDSKVVKKKKEPEKDFINEIIILFSEIYNQYNQLEYQITNKGAERSAAGKILRLYKSKYPNSTSEETLSGLKVYFTACCQINDNWLRANMSIPIIINKFNQINNILKNGNKWQSNRHGASDEGIATAIAKHFATDYTEGSQ